MSKLWFRYSSMNSGKTSSLLQVQHNYHERGMNTILTKPSIDSKGGRFVVSRVGLAQEVDFLITSDMSLKEELLQRFKTGKENKAPIAAVIIDEAQFLTPRQVEELLWVAVNENMPILTYGLRTDFRTYSFPGSSRLLELAHNVEEIKNICNCGRKAIFNARKNEQGDWVKEGSQVAIDGEQVTYDSLCAKCYLDHVNNLDLND